MNTKSIKAKSIDDYIAAFPKDTQVALEAVRSAIQKAAPEAEETISYAIPTFKYNGTYLIYFAGYKNHIGLYPIPTEKVEFEEDFSSYKTSGKGAIQFPLSKPMPTSLIVKIVTFRLQEYTSKAKIRKKATSH